MHKTSIAAAAVALAVVFALPAGAAGEQAQAERGITVSGSATERAAPTSAQWSFGVVAQAPTASAALEQSSRRSARVIAALKAAGVAAADLRTVGVSLSPRTDDRGEEVVGYTASNTVLATVRDVARSGRLIDEAVEAGANTVYGPSFLPGDVDALYREALEKAFEQARAKARALAAKSGLTLGKPTAIVEGGGGPVPMPAVAEAGGRAADTPIEPGQSEITATVTVTFAAS